MKTTYYFSHDSNARHDMKIQALRSVYGVSGYGKYWIMIEMLRESSDFRLRLNDRVLMIALSREFESTPDEAKKFVFDCIYEFGLFVCDDEFFWSDSLVQRMELAEVKRNANKANGIKGGRPRKEQQEQAPEATSQPEAKPDKPKQEKPVRTKNATVAHYSEDVEYLSNLLMQRIRENNPQAKNPSDYNKWKDSIRLMLEADGYNFQQVAKMIEWCQSDDFWKSNILSAKKLREKAGTIVLQMQRTKRGKQEPESVMDTYNRLLKYVNGEEEDDGQERDAKVINIDSIVI